MRKRYKAGILAMGLSAALSFTAFAGQWQQNTTGWWYQNDDNSYPANQWVWIDGNGDGVSESYYFDSNGYMAANTTTPDGYTVNGDGAWVVDGVVQTQAAQASPQAQDTDIYKQMENVQAIMPKEIVGEYGTIYYVPEGLDFDETELVCYDACVDYWVRNPQETADYLKELINKACLPSATEEQLLGMIKGILAKYPH